MYFVTLVLENLVISSDDNEDLIYCLKVNFYFLHGYFIFFIKLKIDKFLIPIWYTLFLS